MQWARLILIGTSLQCCATSNVTNATCSNITIYDQIEKGTVPLLQVKLNLTLSQLKTNLNDVMKTFNDLYHDQSIGFVLNATGLSANNDVCQHKISHKLSPNNDSFLRNYKCPWEYQCDYDPRRIPQVIWQADCGGTWQCSCSDGTDDCTGCISNFRRCTPVYYPVPILYNYKSCSLFDTPGNWRWSVMNVAVACASSDDIAFG